MINIRGKGAEGEREFCRWLQETLELKKTPERNLDQVRNGGADICDIHPFMFEVKRCQALAIRDWWIQVKTATKHDPALIPIVAYRQNRKPWRFLLSASYIGLEKGYIRLEELEFKIWIRKYFNLE